MQLICVVCKKKFHFIYFLVNEGTFEAAQTVLLFESTVKHEFWCINMPVHTQEWRQRLHASFQSFSLDTYQVTQNQFQQSLSMVNSTAKYITFKIKMTMLLGLYS